MSKKTSIVIVVLIAIVIIGGLFFVFRPGNQGQSNQNQNATTSPFGNTPGNKFINVGGGTNQNNQTGPATSTRASVAALFEIYKNPTAGSIIFTNKSRDSVLRFIDRGTGNAYEYLLGSGAPSPTRLTNTTIPKIEEAVWSPLGDKVILRYLSEDTDTIKSFSGQIKTSTSTSGVSGEITGSFLATNIDGLAIDPLGNTVFGLFKKTGGAGSFGVSSALSGTNKKQIFDSPITYWNISWPKENTIAFTTKPSANDDGYLFFFNPQTQKLTKILSHVSGLGTVVNSDANLIGYSGNTDNSFLLKIYDIKNNLFSNFSLPTLADKCVWGIKNNKILYCAVPTSVFGDNYPDAWYEGTESFSDDIWKIDTTNHTTSLIYQIASGAGAINIDAVNLSISADDVYLAFTNKNDLGLWVLNISGLIAIPVGD